MSIPNKRTLQMGFAQEVKRLTGRIRAEWSESERQTRKLQALARQIHLARFAN